MNIASRNFVAIVLENERTSGRPYLTCWRECADRYPVEHAAMLNGTPQMRDDVAAVSDTLQRPADRALANSDPVMDARTIARQKLFALANTLSDEQGISFPAALAKARKLNPVLANEADGPKTFSPQDAAALGLQKTDDQNEILAAYRANNSVILPGAPCDLNAIFANVSAYWQAQDGSTLADAQAKTIGRHPKLMPADWKLRGSLGMAS
jgi:hypothetical protein